MHSERYAVDGIGNAIAIIFAVALLMAYITVRAVLLIIHTLVKYPKKRILWIMLAACIVSQALGVLLYLCFHNEAFLSIGGVGFTALTLTCYIVDLRNSQTLLKEPEPLVKAVLGGKSWWSDDTQAAA